MSGFHPMALSLTELPRFDRDTFGALVTYLRREWRLRDDDGLVRPYARLVFDPDTGEWTGLDSLPDSLTTQQLLEEVRWFRLVGSLRIGLTIDVEIYVFPGTKQGRVGLDLKLGSRVFEAVHAHDPELDDWNEDAKQDLLGFCVGVARTVHADGFMLDNDDGELTPFTIQAGLKRMRREHDVPIMEKWRLYKEGEPYKHLTPAKIMGIRNQFVSKKELEAIWGGADPELIYELPPDYVVLDFLHPLDEEE